MSSVLGGPTASPMRVIMGVEKGIIVNYISRDMLKLLQLKLSSNKIQREIEKRYTDPIARFKPYVIFQLIQSKSRLVDPNIMVNASPDPEDNEVLSVACYVNADYLITLDQEDILSLRDPNSKEIIIEDDEGKEVCRFKIVTPREFLSELYEIGIRL
ncbi:putative toxin-antitoxin system toxin component, PIN family [Thermococcus argininiproducens]|uniref:Toxin-antitoxin system toxin component, PIN family n=1 Tax=Thermococcus argininiproducens TaxID=2866384 RepID=A0A9E7MBY6_9EURY|nr:putative toxin-antitoxin system toxin component, PIN family [Thermococcus argininiproducens]USH00443.1 putative toxin-antitoxin system toxin component, PIN family [Thermococcus argininiproducens]